MNFRHYKLTNFKSISIIYILNYYVILEVYLPDVKENRQKCIPSPFFTFKKFDDIFMPMLGS